MPVSRKLHHNQFSDTPRSRTMLVTRFGVSVLNVVATIEMPTSHHGAARPAVKNSPVPELARFQKNSAGRKLTAILSPMMTQSIVAKWNGVFMRAASSTHRA
jgi:hypothetical protein